MPVTNDKFKINQSEVEKWYGHIQAIIMVGEKVYSADGGNLGNKASRRSSRGT